MTAGGGVDELGVDSDLVPGPAHAAFEDIAHTELLGNLLHLHRFPLVCEDRIASNNKQSGNFRKVGDEIIGHSIAEILLFLVPTHIIKR